MKKTFNEIFWVKFLVLSVGLFASFKIFLGCINCAYAQRGYYAIGGEAILAVGLVTGIIYIIKKFFDWINEYYIE